MKYKYCPNCGTKVKSSAKFCINCGFHFKDANFKETNNNNNSVIKLNDKVSNNKYSSKIIGIVMLIFLYFIVPIFYHFSPLALIIITIAIIFYMISY